MKYFAGYTRSKTQIQRYYCHIFCSDSFRSIAPSRLVIFLFGLFPDDAEFHFFLAGAADAVQVQ